NRAGFIDQSQARTTHQAPSIRVHHAGCAAHYRLFLIRVCHWLATYLPRMPLDRREARDCLKPGGPICSRPNPTPLHQHHCIFRVKAKLFPNWSWLLVNTRILARTPSMKCTILPTLKPLPPSHWLAHTHISLATTVTKGPYN
uniref:Integron gene cassette protein n=1 Tax=Mesocestoides corti TaxID=53468 RepID=A0A5K3FGG7_MESCO